MMNFCHLRIVMPVYNLHNKAKKETRLFSNEWNLDRKSLVCFSGSQWDLRRHVVLIIIKRGGAGGRFGDCLYVHCANLPYIGAHNQFTNTKFTKPNIQSSMSNHNHAQFHRGPTKNICTLQRCAQVISWNAVSQMH